MGLLPIGWSQVDTVQLREIQARYQENCILNASIISSCLPLLSAGVMDFILPDHVAIRSLAQYLGVRLGVILREMNALSLCQGMSFTGFP